MKTTQTPEIEQPTVPQLIELMDAGLLAPQAFFDLKLFPLTDELVAGVQSGQIPRPEAERLKTFILAETARRLLEKSFLVKAQIWEQTSRSII